MLLLPRKEKRNPKINLAKIVYILYTHVRKYVNCVLQGKLHLKRLDLRLLSEYIKCQLCQQMLARVQHLNTMTKNCSCVKYEIL